MASPTAFPILYVEDVRRATAFYSGVLGFEEAYRFPPGDDAGFVSLGSGPGRVALCTWAGATAVHGLPVGPTEGHWGEVCVDVDDLDAVVARVRAAGLAVHLGPVEQPWGERMAIVADPDGNLVHLI